MPVYKNYNVEDGLPGSEIYDMLYDKDGYLWFATSFGVSRFDGNVFEKFTVLDGLPDNATIRLYQDLKGRIWFSSYTGKLSYFQNDKITPHPLNDSISKVCHKKFISHIYVDDKDNIWLIPQYSVFSLYKVTPNNDIIFVDDYGKDGNDYSIFFQEREEGYLWGLGLGVNKIKSKNAKIKVYNNTYYFYTSMEPKANFCHYYKKAENNYFITYANELFHVVDHKIVECKKFKNEITDIFLDMQGRLWVSQEYLGVHVYPNDDLTDKPKHYFDKETVSKVLQDREGNYWISTVGNGLFFVPSIEFEVFNKNSGYKDYKIIVLETYKDRIYFSTSDNFVYEFIKKPEVKIISKVDIEQGDKFIVDIMKHSDGSIWFARPIKILRYDKNGSKSTVGENYKTVYDISERENTSVIVGTGSGFVEISDLKMIFHSEDVGFKPWILKTFEDRNNVLWIGAMNGLFSLKDGKYKYYGDDNPLLSLQISDICETKNFLWIGTRVKGLIVRNEDSMYHIDEANGLSSNVINCIYNNNDSIIWVGTNKGLNRINILSKDSFDFKITSYTNRDGLPSNEINDIKGLNGKIFLGTNKGLVCFIPEQLKQIIVSPLFKLLKVRINENDTTILEEYKLKYFQNNITFFFKGISLKYPKNITYKYKFEGIDKQWFVTKNTSVRYPDLAAGEYIFYLHAGILDTAWTKDPIKIKVQIQKHFTNTQWFASLVASIILLILVAIFFVILRNQKRKSENKRKLIASQLQALRSQMNPHFIFNSLNSIQNFILQRNLKNADIYLANFSSLMRKILENSKYNLILLSEGIETIELYLGLEQLRFDHKFDYQIKIDKAINPRAILIPPMLIQPFLENAIWHGLMPKENQGFLKISIEKVSKGMLLCGIEDNGVGRKQAPRKKTELKNHKSTGMKNIEERLGLLNKMNKMNIELRIIDLYDDEDRPSGTRIELNIPYDNGVTR